MSIEGPVSATVTRASARAQDDDYKTGLTAIARAHGLSFEDVRSKRRFKAFVAARLECYRYLQARGWSTTRIGAYFHRDHSSVVQAVASAERRAEIAKYAKGRHVRYAAIRAAGERK